MSANLNVETATRKQMIEAINEIVASFLAIDGYSCSLNSCQRSELQKFYSRAVILRNLDWKSKEMLAELRAAGMDQRLKQELDMGLVHPLAAKRNEQFCCHMAALEVYQSLTSSADSENWKRWMKPENVALWDRVAAEYAAAHN